MTAIASSGGGAHRIQASAVRGWPALLLALVVLGAAWYAFSPRPLPPFPATRVFPNKLLLNDIARDGSRLIAVGEQGVILLADDPHGPWRQVNVSPQRGSTLTRVGFVDKNTALAMGHDGWILRSEDAGETWKEVAFDDSDQAAPLLDLAGPFNGKLYAVGGFGTFMDSSDQGRSWQTEKSDVIGDKHLYGMLQGDGGVLLLVGEQGEMLRSADGGKTWQPLKQIYNGSFFGALSLPGKVWLAYGMRGHVFYSKDQGQTWQQSKLPQPVSLFGGAVTRDGKAVLVGEEHSVLVSDDGGAHFTQVSAEGRESLDAVLPLGQGSYLLGGEKGLELLGPEAPTKAQAPAGAQP